MSQNTIKFVGQDPTSFDCGYFAGFAAAGVDRTGGITFEITRDLVYQARNDYLSPNNPHLKLTPDTSSAGGMNFPTQMPIFLQSLRCFGYQSSGIHATHALGTTKDPHLISAALRRHMRAQPSRDVMLMQILNPRVGHWLVVLGRMASKGLYSVYDPGRTSNYYFEAPEDKLVEALAATSVHGIAWRYENKSKITEKHRVQNGDSLSIIAGRYWEDVLLFPLLFDANAKAIGSDWNRLSIGTLLDIPDKRQYSREELDEARRRARNWR